jgi:hypothetical protein
VAGNQQGSRQVWLWGVGKQRSVGHPQPHFPLPPHSFWDIVAELARELSLAAEGLTPQLLLLLLPGGCHTYSTAPMCSPNRHCSLPKLVSNFALFISVFHLDFFGWFKFERQFPHGDWRERTQLVKEQSVCVCVCCVVSFRGALESTSRNRVDQPGPWFMAPHVSI